MHPREQKYSEGVSAAHADFGLDKLAMSPVERQQKLDAYRSRPKGMAAVQAQSAAPVPGPIAQTAPPGAALAPSQMQMTNPMTPPVLPGSSGLEFAAPKQFGYGTPGLMPGAQVGARGQVVGLPNKLAQFTLR